VTTVFRHRAVGSFVRMPGDRELVLPADLVRFHLDRRHPGMVPMDDHVAGLTDFAELLSMLLGPQLHFRHELIDLLPERIDPLTDKSFSGVHDFGTGTCSPHGDVQRCGYALETSLRIALVASKPGVHRTMAQAARQLRSTAVRSARCGNHRDSRPVARPGLLCPIIMLSDSCRRIHKASPSEPGPEQVRPARGRGAGDERRASIAEVSGTWSIRGVSGLGSVA